MALLLSGFGFPKIFLSSCYFLETATRICPEPKFFTCRNQRCIHANKTCDKRDDCGDLSDEFDCKYEITACDNETEFLCSDKQRCIPLVNLCDSKPLPM